MLQLKPANYSVALSPSFGALLILTGAWLLYSRKERVMSILPFREDQEPMVL
ncbi:MAG: hypothetical protein IPI00_02860 [Flavobacteriales bacterium]|nr:hypothetical protein [Flavobacteriales bacterium]MBK7296693.1 hypothetical protein [Flavobacteriales bacterium]MBK9536771.1 hypothetical protein [Flavobacteriales bacterium]MBP9138251.1 hypothetical protein [Flavobacteriales bacterium]HQV52777.1 hypothetical protein [Flavobacteriales bacterium]